MSERVGLPPGFTPGLQTGLARQGAEAQQQRLAGSFKGEAVEVTQDAVSLLQNAAEELTFGAASFKSRRELGEFKAARREPAAALREAERVEDRLEKLPDFDRTGADDLLRRLLARGNPSREALDEALEGFHEDIAYQQAALDHLDRALAGSDDPGAKALREKVQAKLAENLRTMAPAIQAGLNVTAVALASASDRQEVQALRDLYRETVLDHESLGKSWENIVARYGDGDLGAKISFLLKALGADLAARGPSIPPVELKAILDETQQLETLNTMRERATAFMGRLHARFGAAG